MQIFFIRLIQFLKMINSFFFKLSDKFRTSQLWDINRVSKASKFYLRATNLVIWVCLYWTISVSGVKDVKHTHLAFKGFNLIIKVVFLFQSFWLSLYFCGKMTKQPNRMSIPRKMIGGLELMKKNRFEMWVCNKNYAKVTQLKVLKT